MKARKKAPLSSLFQQPSQQSPPCKSQPQSASPFEGETGVPAVPSGRADQTNQMLNERWEEGFEHGSSGGGPRRRQLAAAAGAPPTTSDKLDRLYHRWSTYTADTSVTALESEDSFVKEVIGKEEDVCVGVGNSSMGDGSVSVVDVVLPSKYNGTTSSSSFSSSRESSPSPSPEDSLNAALASMLSTANELLSSTMAARSDLARLQTIENALDAELDRREERIMMEIQNNAKMSEWVENASLKLDRMLLDSSSGSSSSNRAMRPSIMTTNWGGRQDSSTAAANTATSSSKHWRSTSTTSQTVHTLDTNTSLGIFEAKDEHATISKSAAKRLEKVLQRANSNNPLHQYHHHHHQSSSPGPSRSRAASTSIDDPSTTTTPTASRMKSSNNDNLSSKFGISASSGEATESTSSVVTSTTPLSARLPQPSEMAVVPSSSSSSSGASTSVDTTPSVTSDSAPDSTVESRSRGDDDDDDDEEEEEEEARAALDNINDSLDPQQALFLTPPTPLEELPSIEGKNEGGATIHRGVPPPLTKRSISSLRSPNPLRTPGHASSGSFVSEAALGQMVLDENGRAIFSPGIGGGQHGRHPSSANGKGAALEALRRLNGGSSFGSPSQQTQQHQHNNQSSSSNGSAPPGWGGTFASWVGITTSSPH